MPVETKFNAQRIWAYPSAKLHGWRLGVAEYNTVWQLIKFAFFAGVVTLVDMVYTGSMSICPSCQDQEHQVKAGRTGAGSQMYKCKRCNHRYTPHHRQMYSNETRQLAIRLYADGWSLRMVARQIGVHHVTVMNWVKAHADQLPPPPTPKEEPLHIIEMDELHTFIGRIKTDVT